MSQRENSGASTTRFPVGTRNKSKIRPWTCRCRLSGAFPASCLLVLMPEGFDPSDALAVAHPARVAAPGSFKKILRSSPSFFGP